MAGMAIEGHIVIHILTLDLKGITVLQPVVWDFHLGAIHNFLLEDAIIVPDAIAPSRDLHAGQRIQETGG